MATSYEVPHDGNDSVCGACLVGGELMCCEACPAAFHYGCAGYGEQRTPGLALVPNLFLFVVLHAARTPGGRRRNSDTPPPPHCHLRPPSRRRRRASGRVAVLGLRVEP